ncbi:MAG: DNA polymerase III subunit gamma/tau [Lachnospiraceae bacterium]|nr:DNA polymerase III subunit gamma/tau [Lachnospiraceae bacterium]
MSYVALYRKFRPADFSEVRGQDHIVTTLKNQLRTGRIGHAYLFTGTRGTGKTTMAKIFARAVNCENPGEDGPCGECECCRAIASGASMNVLEIDAASNNGVENVREIIEGANYHPTQGKYKVYIIDEVHMLSTSAFNALLKTLEEPPAYVIFILATTEVHKLPVTIISRCQRYDFKRISAPVIEGRMKELIEKEQLQVEEKAIRYIAKKADGALRDALSLLDQCIAFQPEGELTYDRTLEVLGAVDTEVFSGLLRSISGTDVREAILVLDEVVNQGRELTQFITDFTWYLRNIMLMQASEELEEVVEMSTENLQRLKEDAQLTKPEQIRRYLRIFSELIGQTRYATQKRVLIELALIRLCRPETDGASSEYEDLADRIRAVEERMENGIVVSAPGSAGTGTSGAAAGPMQSVQPPKLPKAVPEDVRKIVGSWNKIAGGVSAQLSSILQKCTPSLGTDEVLELVFDKGDVSAYRLGSREEYMAELRQVFADYAGGEVEFRVKESESHEEYAKGVPDLRQFIAFDITEES